MSARRTARPPRRTGALAAGIVLALSGAAAADPPARLELEVVPADPAPGQTVTAALTATWDGPADALRVLPPTLRVPEGAAARRGAASATFDGRRTTHRTEFVVTLPEVGNEFEIGPGKAAVLGPDGTQEAVAPARRVGRPAARQVVAGSLGTVAVFGAVALWLGLRWRSLPPDP